MINNRQAGRRRGRGGGNNNTGGPRQGGQGNGSRIDSRARGNATQLHEKYKNMASDAQRAGDRVSTEYYLQFADHYFRVLSEQRGRFDEQPRGRNDFDDDGDGEDGGNEFGDEGEPIRAGEQANDRGEQGRDQGRDQGREQGRDDRGPREDRDGNGNGDGRAREANGDSRPRTERDGGRDSNRDSGRDGGREVNRDTNREGSQREFRRDRNDGDVRREANGDGRAERPRGDWQDRPDNREPRRERRPETQQQQPQQPQPPGQLVGEIAGQRRADPPQPGESLEHRAEEVLAADRPLDVPARRRGRPPRAVVAVESGGEPAGIAADRLPPSLSASLTVAANDEDGGEPKPRRRRARPAEDSAAE